MSDFPTSLDTLTDPSATSKLNSPDHASQHAGVNDAIEKIEAKVGINGSDVTTTHDYKLSGVTGSDKAASLAGVETFTNKTHTSPKINEDVVLTATATELNLLDGMTDIDTDGTLAANSDTVIPTQKSVKTYVDTEVGAISVNRAFSWYLDGTSIVANEVGAKYIVPQDMTVVKIMHKTTSGTATIRIQKDTTDIDASISVTSSVASETSITSAALTAGEVLTLDITAASSCVGLTVIVECTQP